MLWSPDFVDPAAYINRLLDGRHAGGTNLARFDEPPYNAQMQQASRLQGGARAKAYAELDLRLARDAAPLAAGRRAQRGDAGLGTRAEEVHAATAGARAHDGLPQAVTRRLLVLACLAAPSLLAVAVLPGAQGSTGAREGGIFRISFQGSSSLQAFDHVDPALAYTRESWALLDTVCARLMRYRDRPPPQGYQLVPEVAAAPPAVSHGGRTWTFRLRAGFRFSDGRPVRADAFAQAIYRTMAPGVDSPAYTYTRAIVGAEDVHAGRAARASGVVARGRTLAVTFTRPVGEFDAWTTMPFFCAVPPTLPPDAEGVRRFPGAGPYVVQEYRPDERITIRRNRYYGGDRVHHVDGFDVDLHANSAEEVLDRIEAGRADWGYTLPQAAFLPGRRLIDKYGINYSRFWVMPGLTVATSFSTLRGRCSRTIRGCGAQ